MARKEKNIRLAFLTDYSIDKIVDAHIRYVSTPKEEPDEENSILVKQDGKLPLWIPAFKVVEEGEPAPRKAPLYPKYEFLIHVIIMRCRQGKGACRLDYSFFTDLFGKHYGKMLHNLSLMGIIYLGKEYEKGKHSRLIELLDWNISFKQNVENRIIREYFKELEKDEKKKRKERKKAISKTLGKEFYDCYSNNLSNLDLVRRDEALEYVFNRSYINQQQEHFYKSSIENFENKALNITRVDDRGRIYHYLTNCPRVLRKYFNIRNDIDISNSQPLLFCNFLIKKYNIDISIIEFINNIDINYFNNNKDNNNHNKGKQLRKLLKHSDLEVHNLKDIPSDVLQYIYTCMKGMFWDDFVSTFHELDRGEVKENLFREVFYSNGRTMRYKEYGKVFAKIYPHVWSLIRQMKGDAELLCNRITKVESNLFHAILGKCFERGWVVISIHDAVVVLDVEANNTLSTNEVEDIIRNAYKEVGLIPTIKTTRFG